MMTGQWRRRWMIRQTLWTIVFDCVWFACAIGIALAMRRCVGEERGWHFGRWIVRHTSRRRGRRKGWRMLWLWGRWSEEGTSIFFLRLVNARFVRSDIASTTSWVMTKMLRQAGRRVRRVTMNVRTIWIETSVDHDVPFALAMCHWFAGWLLHHQNQRNNDKKKRVVGLWKMNCSNFLKGKETNSMIH